MKKKVLLMVSLMSVLALGACNDGTTSNVESSYIQSESSLVEESSSSISESISSSEEDVEKFEVILPKNVSGVEFSLSKENPVAGDRVRLYVKNTSPDSRRIDSLTMNATKLEANYTNENNTYAYDFVMPKNANALIEIEVVDVYLVTVSTSVNSYISLDGIGNGLFKEGEIVTFTPTAFAGYYFKDVSLVDGDVSLTSNNDGSYSFNMPSHAVTVTATTGNNVYAVSYNNENKPWSLNFASGTAFEFGSVVEFNVEVSSGDLLVKKVLVEGYELSPVDGKYRFAMPSFPVNVEVEYEMVYKTVSVENSAHFNAYLTTLVNGEEVAVSNENVLSNQDVYIDVNDDHVEGSHGMVIDSVKVYSGTSETELTNELNISEVDNKYVFTTNDTDLFYKVVINEKEAPSFLVGSYKGVTLSNAYSTQTLVFEEDGSLSRTSYAATISETSPTYKYTTEQWGSVYEYVTYISPSQNALLEFNVGYSYNGTPYPNSVSSYNYALSMFVLESQFATTVHSLIVADNADYVSEYYGEFISYTQLDGSTITCYFDFTTMTPYWDATAILISGSDGLTANDVVEIKSSEGNLLNKVKLSSKKAGYQYRVVPVSE